MARPSLIISLDFELHWGLRDHSSVADYRENLLGVRQAIPGLLGLFSSRGVHATWATVGMLFCRSKEELRATLPRQLPRYRDAALSPYDLDSIGEDEAVDPFHYAPTLVEAIARTPGQEVGTHTFSHFYCLAEGQTAADFDADLASAAAAASRFGITLRSLVFPRNQENMAYRAVMARHGIEAIRGSVGGWPHSPSAGAESKVKRAVRLADSFVPVSGARTFRDPHADSHGIVDVPASAFLRPYAPPTSPLGALNRLKLRRLTGAMTTAAARGEMFHLWWHPHNFGKNLPQNLAMLTTVLDHFAVLAKQYGMESLSMGEVASRVKGASDRRDLDRSA